MEDMGPAVSPSLGAAAVKTRAVAGIKALSVRTVLSLLLRVISSLCLARLLFPRDYGVFGVAAYITGIGLFLSDAGLAGALVRQSAEPTEDEMTTVFWCQQAITGCVAVSLVAASPWLAQAYHLSHAAVTLLVAMALGLFLNSLRVVPMLALERRLQFSVIARCEMIENVAQTLGTIGFAALGWGAWALAGGGLLRGVVGLGCIWAASPWRPRGRFQANLARDLARFGIPFQLNALLPTLLGAWQPLAVSRMLGLAALGFVNWAINLASVPLMLSAVMNRVAFPAYSRIQHEPEALDHYLRATLRRISAVLCLVVPSAILLCPVAIPVLFHARWTPAIPLVQWFSLEVVLLTLNGILCATQNATGHPSDRLWAALGVGALRGGLGIAAIRWLGLLGLGPAACLASATELFVSATLVRYRNPVCATLHREVFRPLLIAGAFLAVAYGVGRILAPGHGIWQAGLGLLIFLSLMGLRELSAKERTVLIELRGFLRMLRPAAEGSGS